MMSRSTVRGSTSQFTAHVRHELQGDATHTKPRDRLDAAIHEIAEKGPYTGMMCRLNIDLGYMFLAVPFKMMFRSAASTLQSQFTKPATPTDPGGSASTRDTHFLPRRSRSDESTPPSAIRRHRSSISVSQS